MAFEDYIPTADDIIWAVRILALISDKGTLIFPTTRLVYEVDHVAKTLTLQNPYVLYDETDGSYASAVHRRSIAVFRAVEYQVLVKEKNPNENA